MHAACTHVLDCNINMLIVRNGANSDQVVMLLSESRMHLHSS